MQLDICHNPIMMVQQMSSDANGWSHPSIGFAKQKCPEMLPSQTRTTDVVLLFLILDSDECVPK